MCLRHYWPLAILELHRPGVTELALHWGTWRSDWDDCRVKTKRKNRCSMCLLRLAAIKDTMLTGEAEASNGGDDFVIYPCLMIRMIILHSHF